jgi:hypothetical protein
LINSFLDHSNFSLGPDQYTHAIIISVIRLKSVIYILSVVCVCERERETTHTPVV